MIAHIEPVSGWGYEPCERHVLSINACVSRRDRAVPRPPGTGRGNSEVKTSLNNTPQTNGHWHSASGFGKGGRHEREPSPATAPYPYPFLDLCLQGSGFNRAGGIPRRKIAVATRVDGDLGASRE